MSTHFLSKLGPIRARLARCFAVFVLFPALVCVPAKAALTIAMTPSVLSLPIDVAQARGYFAAEGVDVQIVICRSGRACMEMLFDRSVQLAAVTELPVVVASFERNDFAVVATVGTSSGNIRVIGRRSAGVNKPADLADKRIGVIVGSSSHYFLDAYLFFNGIDPRQVSLVPLKSESIVEAMEKRQIDAMSGYPFHTSAALKSLGADGSVFDAPRIYAETFNLVAQKRSIAGRTDELRKVLRALDRAERYIAEQPQHAKQLVMTRTLLERPVIDSIFPNVSYRLSLEQSLITAMEGESRWAVREGHVSPGLKSPNYLEFVDQNLLRSAVPTAPSR